MAKDTTTARRTVTYVDGAWHDGNPKVLGPRSHAVWLGSAVFDGARAIQGRAPDLDRHCARVVNSARLMGLEPMLTGTEIEDLARDGIGRFTGDAELYICPMFYPEDGFIVPDPASTHFILTVHESPLPEPSGISACLSSFRRPARDMAPTEAKAACLYPNVARCLREAQAKGFETAVVLDPNGNVAEFAYANLFMVKDGVVATPAPNGTFLNGITRQRVIELLRSDGVEVIERSISFSEVLAADELFGTGNYAKVVPYTRIEDRELEAGQMTRRARELYFRFAGQAAM
jgi:branched-chain amino acid aminotransferase